MLICFKRTRDIKSKTAELRRVVELVAVSGSVSSVSNLCVVQGVSDAIARSVL